ncbi:MAG: hypothetical protein M3R38_07710 [Actinomycetota bacterium]|nr:hypothetical protein [Actinomycetota bacterium]
MRGGVLFRARRLLGTAVAGVFSTFFGLTLTLLLAAAAGFSAFQLEQGACYPSAGLTDEVVGYGRTEFSLLPLGVRCTWRTEDGSILATTLEPAGYALGWALTVLVALGVAMLILVALLVVARARGRGHGKLPSSLFGILSFFAPPLGVLLAATARDPEADPVRRAPGRSLLLAGTPAVWAVGLVATAIFSGIFFVVFETERLNAVCKVPPSAANRQWPVGSAPPRGEIGSLTLRVEDSPLPFVKRCVFADAATGKVLGTNRAGLGPLLIAAYALLAVLGSAALVARSTAGRGRRAAMLYVAATLVMPPLGLLLAAVRGPAGR